MSEAVNDQLLDLCATFAEREAEGQGDRVLLKRAEQVIAAAREQQAEDCKPIDQEWLCSIGFVADEIGGFYFGEIEADLEGGWAILPHVLPNSPKTRGDVARLLAALQETS